MDKAVAKQFKNLVKRHFLKAIKLHGFHE